MFEISHKIESCSNCPHFKQEHQYITDGESSFTLYYCSKGIFGSVIHPAQYNDCKLKGKEQFEPPKTIHEKCTLNKN